jgi:hypothetical protein
MTAPSLRDQILAALATPAVTPLVLAVRMGIADRHQAVREELTRMQAEGLVTGTITGTFKRLIRRANP